MFIGSVILWNFAASLSKSIGLSDPSVNWLFQALLYIPVAFPALETNFALFHSSESRRLKSTFISLFKSVRQVFSVLLLTDPKFSSATFSLYIELLKLLYQSNCHFLFVIFLFVLLLRILYCCSSYCDIFSQLSFFYCDCVLRLIYMGGV